MTVCIGKKVLKFVGKKRKGMLITYLVFDIFEKKLKFPLLNGNDLYILSWSDEKDTDEEDEELHPKSDDKVLSTNKTFGDGDMSA